MTVLWPAGEAGADAGLGVEPRPEGWAVWNVWTAPKHRYALVLCDVTVTHALLRNWSAGIAVQPGEPFRHHIAQRVDGRLRPMITDPWLADTAGLAGRP